MAKTLKQTEAWSKFKREKAWHPHGFSDGKQADISAIVAGPSRLVGCGLAQGSE